MGTKHGRTKQCPAHGLDPFEKQRGDFPICYYLSLSGQFLFFCIQLQNIKQRMANGKRLGWGRRIWQLEIMDGAVTIVMDPEEGMKKENGLGGGDEGGEYSRGR